MIRVNRQLHALKFDGVNDYAEGTGATWNWTQPWTFFFKGIFRSNAEKFFFSFLPFGSSGLSIGMLNSNTRLRLAFSNNQIIDFGNAPNTINTEVIIQVSYDPSLPALERGRCFINGIEYPRVGGSFINFNNPSNIIRLGTTFNSTFSFPRWYNGIINNMSFVNYTKTPAEITDDFNNGYQSEGSGAYLLNIIPTYPNIIKSLNPTLPFKEQAQNLDMNIFGKTNPMILNTDFEQLQGNEGFYNSGLIKHKIV